MAQPGRPDKPDALWWELEKVLALAGPQALNARDSVRQLIKTSVLAMWVDAADDGEIDMSKLKALTRDHIYGWPPPGS